MDAILVELSQVLDHGRILIKDLQNKQKTINDQSAILSEGLAELKSKQANFSKREAAIVPIENINKVKADAHALMESVQAEKAQLEADKKAFDNYKHTETNKLNDLRLAVNKESSLLEAQKKYIDDEVNKRVKQALADMGIKIKE